MIRIAVNGALGRMGSRILFLASESAEWEVAGRFDAKNDVTARVETLSPSSLKGKGVLIDFSSPAGTQAGLAAALKAHWGIVVGTTGLEDALQSALKEASKSIPVVFSSNMSVGVNVVLALIEKAAQKLPQDFSVQISEAHHRHKKDAPSGTALMLAKQIAEAKDWDIQKLVDAWRAGKFNIAGDKIRMNVIREGEIVGDHTVLFDGPAESIEITHRAKSRDTFARGALLAARFAATKTTGFFTMADVLDFQTKT